MTYMLKKLKNIILDIVFILVVLLSIYLFIISPMTVFGKSMNPALVENDTLLVNKLHYYLTEPKHEEIVVFKYSKNREIDYVSRIIALEGESIEIKPDGVYLNNKRLTEKYVVGTTKIDREDAFMKENQQVIVPEKSVFVMGDNREYANDSRHFGFVSISDLIGLPFIRILPFNSLNILW